MPGLVALVDPRGQVPEDLDAMAEALPRRPWHKEERVSVPGFAAAVVGDGTESVARHGDLVLVLFGHVHGDVHDRGDLRSPAARLVDVADRRSPQALTEFDGAYVALVWDRRLRALHAVTDAGGWRRLHWRQAPDGRVALATRGDAVARVSGISSAVDVEGAADLLTLGFLQGERTLLDGVRLAEPGASLTVEDGRVRAASNRGRPVLPTLEGSDGELIEALGGHVERAVARALAGVPQDEELVIQLTGGLDSRVLAGMIRRLDPDRPTTAVTIGHAHAHDVTSARAVARALGLPHHVEPVGADYLSRLGPAGVDRVEGQVTLDAAWVLAVDTPLDERLGPPVVNGFLADALTGANLPRSVRDLTGLPEEQAAQGYFDRYLNRVFRPPELTRLLAPGVADAAARPAEVTVSAYLGAAGDHHACRCTRVDLRHRQRRFYAMHLDVLDEAVGRVVDPFVDGELVEFCLRLPEHLLVRQRAYKAMVLREFPELARIPVASTGQPLDRATSKTRAALTAPRLAARAANRRLRAVTSGRLGHEYQDFVHPRRWFLTRSRAVLEDLRAGAPILEGLLDVDAVRAQVDAALATRRLSLRQMRQVAALATLRLWLSQKTS